MVEEVYRRLARRLDAIPNGFPATESGAELRLLASIFTPEEAEVASVMRMNAEPAEVIADRLGADHEEMARFLRQMVRQGLIYADRGQGALHYGLMPFVVGVYEEQIGRINPEMAARFEEYYREMRGVMMDEKPEVHRVIPIETAIDVDIAVFPFERASEMLNSAKSWGVRDCICRKQKELIGEGCSHPMENCLVFAPVEGAFQYSKVTRAISRDEAFRILREAEQAGLVHSTGNYKDGVHYICNCCTCSCGVLRGIAEYSVPAAARSSYLAVVDADECIGCEACLPRCQFGALLLIEDVVRVEPDRCLGCGQCTVDCPNDAIQLHKRPAVEDVHLIPTDRVDWLERRAANRGISLEDIL